MSSHVASALASDVSAFLKSAGISCTTPPEIVFCDIDRLSEPVGGQGDSGRGSQSVTQLDAPLLLVKRFPGGCFASPNVYRKSTVGRGLDSPRRSTKPSRKIDAGITPECKLAFSKTRAWPLPPAPLEQQEFLVDAIRQLCSQST